MIYESIFFSERIVVVWNSLPNSVVDACTGLTACGKYRKQSKATETQLNSQLNEHLWTQVLQHLNVHIYLDTISYRYYNHLISRTDLSPIYKSSYRVSNSRKYGNLLV